MRFWCVLLSLLCLASPVHAQDLSQQVLRLLVRDNVWTGLQDFTTDTDGSGGIKISNGTPTTTTNKLYAVGGNLFWNGSLVTTAAGAGTVTSVALTAPGIFSVSGSPVTSSGTLSFSLASQSANQIFAGPATGIATTPTFRSLVDADIPDTITVACTNCVTWASVSKSGSSLADLATRSAGDLTSGTMALARLTDGATAGVPLVAGGAGDPQYAALNLASATAITGTLATANSFALTGDVTKVAGSLVTTLASTGVTAATYGSATAIPVITVDVKGRITSATTASLSSSISPSVLSGGSRGGMLVANASNQYAALNPSIAGQVPRYNGTDTVWSLDGSAFTNLNMSNAGSGSVPIANGGTGNTTAPSNGQLLIGNGTTYVQNTLTGTANQVNVTNGVGTVTLSLPQAVATSSTPQFARIGAGTGADATAAVYSFGPLKHRVIANGNSGAALALSFDLADWHTLTLTNNCTLTFNNAVPGSVYRMQVVQDGVGSRTVTWPGTVRWVGAAAPTLTTTAGRTDIVTCLYDGSFFYCSAQLNYN